MTPCLIDTNVLIHALNGDAQASILSRVDDAIANQARYSVVTRMELLGWNGHTADSRRETAALLTQLMEISLTPTIVALVIDIRSTITIKLPDAIIAASALAENLPLMTCNTGDFRRIASLVVIDPFVT